MISIVKVNWTPVFIKVLKPKIYIISRYAIDPNFVFYDVSNIRVSCVHIYFILFITGIHFVGTHSLYFLVALTKFPKTLNLS